MIHKQLRYLSMILLFLMISSSVWAVNNVSNEVHVDIIPVVDTIKPSEAAEFFIDVYNNMESKDKFMISGDDIGWSFQTSPARDYSTGFEVKPSDVHRLHVYVKPTDARPDIYSLTFNLRGDFATERRFLEVKVTPQEPHPDIIYYDPNITVEVSVPNRIDPRAKQQVKVVITNNNALLLEDVELTLVSRLINEKSIVTLPPNNVTSVVFTIDLDDQLRPQEDVVNLEIIYNNKTLSRLSEEYEISSYLPLFERNMISEDSFLYTKKVVVLTNTGNVAKKESVRMDIGKFKRFFVSSDPVGELVKDDETYYLVWNVVIEPSDTIQIWVYYNYWPIFALIVLLILIFLIYYMNKDPFLVTKSAEVTESGVIKMLISVKNKRNKKFKNLKLMDRVPNLIKVSKKTELGSMSPSKIFKTKNNETIVTWNLLEFGPLEEIIFSYKIKTSLNIVGKFRLRPAILQIIKKNKKIKIISNDIYVST